MPVGTQREIILRGGLTNTGLVSRNGDTVRRPLRPTSAATKALLNHLQAQGFSGAPRYLGTDDQHREVLSYIPGRVAIAPRPAWAFGDQALISVARLLRRYHDAVANFDASPYDWPHPLPDRFRGNVVSHNDPNVDNVIFRGSRAVALIDFDLASPGSAIWDLACAARLWVPLRAPQDMPGVIRGRVHQRLAMFFDAYGAGVIERAGFGEAVLCCADWCYAVVQDAASTGHPTFSHEWESGGRQRAERTRRWLATHAQPLCDTVQPHEA
jgi:hypothetical protein